ncbi:phage tail tube protein [Rhizobium sp. Leaf386]|uniref:phage tail tube protein n=1 Tax=Rhizobium sp. Leaf386 TaxID=1736359 RepID=UPI000714B72A|nr:phage tail tube protein [Rhizobium sp. Leaf386]KQS95394.1 hypothetical protein ASG50_25555 [Rhizobium sp. Leaf386]
MAVAAGSQTRLAYILQTAAGAIPATPAWQTLRYVTEGLTLDKQTDTPDEVRPDRNVSDIVDVGRVVQGPINTLLSYGTFDDFFSALLCNDWSTNVLKNGNVEKILAFEKTFKLGVNNSFIRFIDCRLNTLDLQLTAKQSITANWGIQGLSSPAPASAILTGATYLDPTTTPVLNAALNVGALTMTGITATPKIQSLSMRITNNLYSDDVIGQYETYNIGLGRFEVSGSMTVLFESADLYSAVRAHDDLTLSVTAGASTGNKYKIDLHKIKAMNGSPLGNGNGRSVIMEVPFMAKYDGTAAASITVTRAVA